MEKRLVSNDFTKQDTLALKGIAILMMVFHHCYRTTNIFKGYDVDFSPFSQDMVVTAAYFMKICVAIFVFITGYGLTVSIRKMSADYCLNREQFKKYIRTRLLKLMSGYWFVYIISFIFCFLMDRRQVTVYFEGEITRDNFASGCMNMLLDITGLTRLFHPKDWDYTLNPDWWYMSLAILLVLLAPLAARLVSEYTLLWTGLVCIFLPRIFGLDGSNDMVRWIFMFLLGIYSAQHGTLQRIKNFMLVKNRHVNAILKFTFSTALLVVLCYAAVKLNHKYFYEFKDGIVPLFVIYYCYAFVLWIPVLRQILMFLGKYALTIYLIHDIIKEVYFADFVYSFHYFWLIYIVFFAISLVVAVVLELLKKASGYSKLIDWLIKNKPFKNEK